MCADAGRPWWRDAVLYNVYCRSFADSNGDGVGDLRGVIEHLDHLAWLGIDGVWLTPVTPSTDTDWGYDVTDYRAVHRELGTMDDLDELIRRAGERGIRILLDLVPNHTSDRHPWFVESRGARDSRRRDWYVWADPAAGGGSPCNWVDFSGAPAWTFDAATGQYYLHNFLSTQPDLNWWNPEVRREFDAILRFWFDRGVAGFRIDTCNVIVKDRRLRDNPAPRATDHPLIRARGQRDRFSANRPEVHTVLRRWRRVAEDYASPRLLMGETWVLDVRRMARYYGDDDEIQLAMNFPFVFASFSAPDLRRVVDQTEQFLPASAWPLWFGSNHDVPRMASRWCAGDACRIRCALLMLLTLRGTPMLFNGDEIGMRDVPIPPDAVRDPLGRRGPERPGRDGSRTPMRWTAGPNAGFTGPGAAPWLPVGDDPLADVASQRDDPASVLRLCRDVIALRRRSDDLRAGSYTALPPAEGVWAWRRGRATTVALNLGDRSAVLDGVDGAVAIGSDRGRDGERLRGRVELRPWEGVIVDAS